MGLLKFLRRLFFGTSPASETSRASPRSCGRRTRRPRRKPDLEPLRHKRPRNLRPGNRHANETFTQPYAFARFGFASGSYFDLREGGDDALLEQWGLPVLHTPDELAAWLGLSTGRLAWLTHRFWSEDRPPDERKAHYVFHWKRKRAGGWRLIESPKPALKAAQRTVLAGILEKVPPHACAHGFVPGRSVITNAGPHVGRRVVLKFDLANFYASVGFSRVTAIFRGLGYCREAALWLARLTTSRLPAGVACPSGDAAAAEPYLRRHLPQGAPTSPALANLSAYALDVRLSGLARAFGGRYTRYADDLTFSGSRGFLRALPTFVPLAKQVIRDERFRLHRRKGKVLRNNQRQTVAGVVVNERTNVDRREFDRLKAILTNCLRSGPASQNRDGRADFAAHLRGRIAHVANLNPARGRKLLALYEQIRW